MQLSEKPIIDTLITPKCAELNANCGQVIGHFTQFFALRAQISGVFLRIIAIRKKITGLRATKTLHCHAFFIKIIDLIPILEAFCGLRAQFCGLCGIIFGFRALIFHFRAFASHLHAFKTLHCQHIR